MTVETDILVAGGGIAGLTAVAAFAADGHRVLSVEPTLPPKGLEDADADLRSTAFLEPSVALLQEIGLWDAVAGYGTDLEVMRLIDAGGVENAIRTTADFRAADLGQARFGVNLPNWPLRQAFATHLEGLAGVEMLSGVRVEGMVARSTGAFARLSDGRQVRAKLVVAADGRDSGLRAASGITVRRWGHGQKALVFAVSHPLPHENVSTEIHRTGGPFTLVPLPDRDGVPHSAVVWMERGPEAGALAAMDEEDFEAALNARACGVLGPLKLATRRAVWPIIAQTASAMAAPRLALIAEAAHVMPPIGAQGLNLSLADIRCLRDLMRGAEDVGSDTLLDRYHSARHGEVLARIAGVDLLNRAALAAPQPLRDLRNMGLRVLDGTPLKQAAMRAGLGGQDLLPGFLQQAFARR